MPFLSVPMQPLITLSLDTTLYSQNIVHCDSYRNEGARGRKQVL